MKRQPPYVSNEEAIQWEMSRTGYVNLSLRWYIGSKHPRVFVQRPGKPGHTKTALDMKLRGAGVTVRLWRGWQVENVIRSASQLVLRFLAGDEATLTERLFEIAKAAYACPEFLASRRTDATDKTIQEAERLLAKPDRTNVGSGQKGNHAP